MRAWFSTMASVASEATTFWVRSRSVSFRSRGSMMTSVVASYFFGVESAMATPS
jgi:hypothetical protein